ncbi:repair protein PSO2 SNM1 [Coemansia sp. RSA 552]|nr:repair protein PSO2 SNM1 [Coemansia sp. RSA 552]
MSAVEMLSEIERTSQAAPNRPLGIPTYCRPPNPLYAGEQKKPLPGYKRMPHTTFTVDAFSYGALDFCTGYFLTHFHSDHYGGLSKRFAGTIYCSQITANCITSKLGLSSSQVHPLPMNTRCRVQDVLVTFIDANHCPGSVIILFEVPLEGGRVCRIVHTGDFRATTDQVLQILRVFGADAQTPLLPDDICGSGLAAIPMLLSPVVDYVYLDTTYLSPEHAFPEQDQVVEAVVEFCAKIQAEPPYLPNFIQQAKGPARSGSAAQAKQAKKPALLLTQWFRPLVSPKPRSTGYANRRRVLFVVGSYTIGKERLFIEIARRLESKIFVSREKRRMLECIGSRSLLELVTDSMGEAQVHVVSMSAVNMRGMSEYLQVAQRAGGFSGVVAFSPTGWSHGGRSFPGSRPLPMAWPKVPDMAQTDQAAAEGDTRKLASFLSQAAQMHSTSRFAIEDLKPRGSSADIAIFPVPYSEHSSFAELARFVCSLKTGRVVPTVYSSVPDKNSGVLAWLRHWQDLNSDFGRRLGDGGRAPPGDKHPTLGLYYHATATE